MELSPVRFNFLSTATLSGLSVFSILGTLFPIPFNFRELETLCICVMNQLAYAYIAYAASILLGLISMVLLQITLNKSGVTVSPVLLILQSIAFITGVIFTILYYVQLTDVI